MARVAFIGLGTMGLPMARQLVSAGVKDLSLALELAGGDTPVAAAALREYGNAQEAGLGSLDYSAVYLGRRGTEQSS